MVLANDPKNFNAKFNMGLVQIERRDYTGALGLLNQAVSLDSTRAVPHLWIGIAKLEMGSLHEAETSLTRSLLMGGRRMCCSSLPPGADLPKPGRVRRCFQIGSGISTASTSRRVFEGSERTGPAHTEAGTVALEESPQIIPIH